MERDWLIDARTIAPRDSVDTRPGRVESILFVELIGGIGDLLMALPAMRALARSNPESRLAVFAFAPGAQLLDGDPDVDEVIVASRGPDGDDGPPAKAELRELLLARQFDLVVSTTRYAGIHELIEGMSEGWTITNLWRGTNPGEPVERAFLRRLFEEGAIKPEHQSTPLEVHVRPEDAACAASWWARASAVTPGTVRSDTVVLNVDAGMPIKRWPLESFRDLGRALRSRARAVAVLTGDSADRAVAVAGEVGGIVVPQVGLCRLAALLSGVGALVSADTGPATLAAGVGVPVVTLFGPTWAQRYGQVGAHQNLQSPFDCPELKPMNFTEQRCWWSGQCIFASKRNCVEDISVEQVLAAVEELLTERGERETRANSMSARYG